LALIKLKYGHPFEAVRSYRGRYNCIIFIIHIVAGDEFEDRIWPWPLRCRSNSWSYII